jgi:hypothetical protein
MITLTLNCENEDQARVYLNAPQYHNLLSDIYQAFRSAEKHGTMIDLLQAVNSIKPDLIKAIDNSLGAY